MVVEAGVGVGHVEKEMLPLVADIVVLEAEEEGEPVEDVLVEGVPRDERVSRETFHVAEGGGGGEQFRAPEGREVVHGDDVVGGVILLHVVQWVCKQEKMARG